MLSVLNSKDNLKELLMKLSSDKNIPYINDAANGGIREGILEKIYFQFKLSQTFTNICEINKKLLFSLTDSLEITTETEDYEFKTPFFRIINASMFTDDSLVEIVKKKQEKDLIFYGAEVTRLQGMMQKYVNLSAEESEIYVNQMIRTSDELDTNYRKRDFLKSFYDKLITFSKHLEKKYILDDIKKEVMLSCNTWSQNVLNEIKYAAHNYAKKTNKHDVQ